MDGFFPRSKVQSKQPVSKIPKCGLCKLNKGCISPRIPHTGKGLKKILIIAEAPGEKEDRRNTQLIGEAGQLLRKLLKKAGINLDRDCWKTNACICRPPKNRTPTDKELEACRPHLIRTIEKTKPNVIIPLGKSAIDTLISPIWGESVEGLARWVGQQIPCQTLNAWICPTYHPSYLLRAKNKVAEVITFRHLKRAFKHKRRPWKKKPNFEKNVIIETKPESVYKWLLQDVHVYPFIVFDYETNMLKPDSSKAEIVSCSVSFDGRRAMAYPWHGKAIDATRALLQNPARKIAANIKFEDRWTRRVLGIKIHGWYWDTVLAAHILNFQPKASGTKFQAFVQLGLPIYDSKLENYLKASSPNTPNRIREIGLEDLLLYNGLDSLVEHKIATKQLKEVGLIE